MAWIESHTVLLRHRKLIELAEELRLKPVYCLGHLHALWHVALEQQEDGDLSSWTDTFIAESSAYRGDAPRYVSLLQKHKWLDGRLLHDWLSHVGLYLTKKYSTSNPQKLREIWAKHGKTYGNNKKQNLPSEQEANEKRTESEPTLDNITKPDKTKDKETPLPPLQGGMIENLGDLPKNKMANDPNSGDRSALLAGGYKKIPNIAGDEMPIKDVPEDIDITKTTASVKAAIIAGNPEKVPRNIPGIEPVGSGVSNSVTRLESLISDLQSPENGQYTEWFETVWQSYPAQRRIGKKLAFRHFKPSVKTEHDFALIKQALSKYLVSKQVKNGYLQNGSTWFNNWRDWIYYEEPKSNIFDEDIIRDPTTGEIQHDPITGEAMRIKRDPITGKALESRWLTKKK